MNRFSRILRIAGLAVLTLGITLPGTASGQVPDGLLDRIEYREIGPTRQGGRFVDYAVPLQQPHTFYAATASGGLWKTVNRGQSFTSLLDETDIISLGAVAVAPSDPMIVWIGSGEGNNSRSQYYGDGVYVSTDAGSTWTHKGLPESHHISRIVIHPRDPDIVYVAANGHLYTENEERGLYRTTDGGETWAKVLDVRAEGRAIGVTDVVMDPRRPKTLYAAAYDKVRRPWTFNEGGPGSGIYKSTNAGRTWTKLTGGLPGGMLGRIGVTISPQDTDILYAVIENANSEETSEEERRQELLEGRPPKNETYGNEIYRTDDAGRTWKKVNEEGRVGGNPPYYYGQIIVDPNDPEHVYNLGVGVTHSVDGGKTWKRAFRFGGDNHALWIDPEDSDHMIMGHDHGMGITYDAGRTWYHPDDMPLAQFYAVGYDMAYPYNVYGGTQDNGSWRGPSTKAGRGPIEFEEWFRVGGGDGMYNEVDPSNSQFLYNESQFGPIRRLDMRTGETRSIRHRGEGLRFNWCAPILVSFHDPDVIYHGANKVLRSDWRGEAWEEISPDLTTADSTKIVGTGNIQYCTVTTLDESPIVPGVLLAGTDDGNVQLTRDGGQEWILLNDRIPDWPGYWVTRVVTSYHDTSTAYVTASGLRRDDFRPFVWKTTDYGKSWRSITDGLPEDESVNVIREDRRNPDLLFLGTDRAVYVSLDGGERWTEMRSEMPAVAVHDLRIHPRENDLIVGTHGRGFYVADISALQEATPEVLDSDAHLFRVEPGIRWQEGLSRATSSQNYRGESEPQGMPIRYWLEEGAEEVRVKVYAGTRLVRDLEAGTRAGLNSVVWDMEGTRPRTPKEKDQFQRQKERMERMGREMRGDPEFIEVPLPPADYRVVLEVGGRPVMEREAVVMPDHWWEDRK
ncbi:MAG: hypothetical protein R6W82_05480 [bacterium]